MEVALEVTGVDGQRWWSKTRVATGEVPYFYKGNVFFLFINEFKNNGLFEVIILDLK
jgi:hypothetical protein